MEPDLATLLLQGHELIAQTSRAHAERWGLGTADRWSLDQQDGRLVWSFEDRTASAAAQVLGSWNSEVNSFVWAWANDSVLPPLRETSERVRDFGAEHDVAALTSSPLSLGEEQVRDLVALAFRVGRCTGLYHPYNGQLATYLVFGPVTIEDAQGNRTSFEVAADE